MAKKRKASATDPARPVGARSDPLIEHLLELMEGIEGVRAKSMFGGHGIFHEDRMFALVAYGRLYLKCGDANVADFEALGLEPFTYERGEEVFVMSYREAPPECLESPPVMRRWVRGAISVAQSGPPPKKRRR